MPLPESPWSWPPIDWPYPDELQKKTGVPTPEVETWTKTGPVKPAATTPGAVPVVAAAWHLELEPATYTLQWGDTLTGLALTYLDSPDWHPIWNAQSPSYRASHSPDKIFVGEVFKMPAQAADRARQLLGKQPIGPGPVQPAGAGGGSSAGLVVAGLVGVTGLAVGVYRAIKRRG